MGFVCASFVGIGSGQRDPFGPASESINSEWTVTVLANDERCKSGLNSAIALPNGTVNFPAACVGACEAIRAQCTFVSVNGGLCVIANDASLGCVRIMADGFEQKKNADIDTVDSTITAVSLTVIVIAILVAGVCIFIAHKRVGSKVRSGLNNNSGLFNGVKGKVNSFL